MFAGRLAFGGRKPIARGLATVLAIAWLFPVSQLVYAESAAIAFERFARKRLLSRPSADQAIYTTDMVAASAARFTKRVLGVFFVPGKGCINDDLVSASVLNQFPMRVGDPRNQADPLPPGTRRIGTTETPFLAPLSYIHLFALEFHRRIDPTIDTSVLSGDHLLPLIEEDGATSEVPADHPARSTWTPGSGAWASGSAIGLTTILN